MFDATVQFLLNPILSGDERVSGSGIKIKCADGNQTKIIVNETAAGSGVIIVETADTLTINRASDATDAAVATAINSSSLFKVISTGSTAEGTHNAEGGVHSHTIYNYTTEEITRYLTPTTEIEYTALLRCLGCSYVFDATLMMVVETSSEYITTNGK